MHQLFNMFSKPRCQGGGGVTSGLVIQSAFVKIVLLLVMLTNRPWVLDTGPALVHYCKV